MRMNLLTVAVAFAAIATTAAVARPDIDAGKREFDRTCRFCHSLTPNEIVEGPSLAGVFGRRAGSVEGFAYSEPILHSKIVWSDGTLDNYLADPAMLGTEVNMCMPGIADADVRANIIEYLKRSAR
ncbi:MAG: c-type cytochrome [Rhodobacteraceae bacterium]|nr:c-type cytochrome [Paracoccaceae bacterium]